MMKTLPTVFAGTGLATPQSETSGVQLVGLGFGPTLQDALSRAGVLVDDSSATGPMLHSLIGAAPFPTDEASDVEVPANVFALADSSDEETVPLAAARLGRSAGTVVHHEEGHWIVGLMPTTGTADLEGELGSSRLETSLGAWVEIGQVIRLVSSGQTQPPDTHPASNLSGKSPAPSEPSSGEIRSDAGSGSGLSTGSAEVHRFPVDTSPANRELGISAPGTPVSYQSTSAATELESRADGSRTGGPETVAQTDANEPNDGAPGDSSGISSEKESPLNATLTFEEENPGRNQAVDSAEPVRSFDSPEPDDGQNAISRSLLDLSAEARPMTSSSASDESARRVNRNADQGTVRGEYAAKTHVPVSATGDDLTRPAGVQLDLLFSPDEQLAAAERPSVALLQTKQLLSDKRVATAAMRLLGVRTEAGLRAQSEAAPLSDGSGDAGTLKAFTNALENAGLEVRSVENKPVARPESITKVPEKPSDISVETVNAEATSGKEEPRIETKQSTGDSGTQFEVRPTSGNASDKVTSDSRIEKTGNSGTDSANTQVRRASVPEETTAARPTDRVTIRVADANGNQMKITVTVSGERVHANISSETHADAQQLKGRVTELQRSLERHGFTDASVAVRREMPTDVGAGTKVNLVSSERADGVLNDSRANEEKSSRDGEGEPWRDRQERQQHRRDRQRERNGRQR